MPERPKPAGRAGESAFEWTNYARLTRWLTVDADLVVLSRALHRRRSRGQPHSRRARSRHLWWRDGGADAAGLRQLRVRHFGPRPLIEDASVTVEGHDTVERRGRLSRCPARLAWCSKLFNLFDAEVSRISTTSTLPACRASRMKASRMSTPIRPFPAPRALVFDFSSDHWRGFASAPVRRSRRPDRAGLRDSTQEP